MAHRVQEQKETCWELKQKGFGATVIAKKLNIDRSTVYELWKKVETKRGEAIAQ